MYMLGKSFKDVGKQLKLTPKTISVYSRDPEVRRLIALLRYKDQLNDGPNHEHRKAVLWRVAKDNEKKRPNTTISAIQEINKMSGTYHDQTTPTGINIQINNEVLPRTLLDRMPETFETRRVVIEDV